ncbi:hypothetical protein [Sphingobium sp. ZW T5_29]|uniref:hypothetical protein n=1 Tax=Sphingobium sp. ZW T5_29 TaxID=3378077 RepID=UPI0038539887
MEQDHGQFSRQPRTDGPWDEPKPRPETHLRASLEAEVAKYEAFLMPPTLEQIMGALSRCLTLTAPSGMTAEDRTEWLTIAAQELAGTPSAYFEDACSEARKTCDHPAKIVPAILGFKPPMWMSRSFLSERLRESRMKLENLTEPKLERKADVQADERRDVAASMGELLKELRAGPLPEGI